MQRKITHYLISACYLKKAVVKTHPDAHTFEKEDCNFIVTLDTYPRKIEIEHHLMKTIEGIKDITILGISGMTDLDYEQYNS
jgi:hypothetical protein